MDADAARSDSERQLLGVAALLYGGGALATLAVAFVDWRSSVPGYSAGGLTILASLALAASALFAAMWWLDMRMSPSALFVTGLAGLAVITFGQVRFTAPPSFGPMLLLLVVLVAYAFLPRVLSMLLMVCTGIALAIIFWSQEGWDPPIGYWLFVAIVTVVVIVAVAQLVDRAEEESRRANVANEQLKSLNATLEERVAEQVSEVRRSRSRIVAAADESRKRIERNIHDGAQQRLVALALDVRLLEEQAPMLSADELAGAHRRISDDLKAALSELRELARGLHPSVLTTDGLGPAVEQLTSRSSIPVAVEVIETRFPEAVETACYFTVAEALANVAKYAEASEAAVRIEQQDGHVRLQVSDNGVGGADPKAGSGLTGLVDRIAALDGTLTVDSPAGVGTTLTVELPLSDKAST